MCTKQSRFSRNRSFKWKVIKFEEKRGNRAAERNLVQIQSRKQYVIGECTKKLDNNHRKTGYLCLQCRIYEGRDQRLHTTSVIVLGELCVTDLLRGVIYKTRKNYKSCSNYRSSNVLEATENFVLFHGSSDRNSNNKKW